MFDPNNPFRKGDSLVDAVRSILSGKPIEEKKMDPVGQEDGDIDNDGDVDKSDKYLKNRRKEISKAMKESEDEMEVEEGSRTFGSAIKKAEVSRQRAIEKAKKWMKRTGKSAEDAVKEFDLFPSDIRKLKEEAGYTDEERKAMDDLVNSLGALGGHRDMKKPRYDPDMVKKPGYDPDIIVQQPRYDPDMVKKPGYDPRVYDPGMERDRTQGLDQDFSKRVQQQNQKNMKLNNSKFSDWGKK